jgi:hypothetical protein
LWYLDYDLSQLERIAEDKLREFDKERLKVPKKIDVIDFTEFYLELEFDPQRLTPNQQILGLTAFNDGYWWIWNEGEELPTRHPVKKGTILIDDRLLEEGVNEGRANFTILHEDFHWILHPRVFAKQEVTYQWHCNRANMTALIGRKKPRSSGIQKTEWQANAAAAAFLMPREAVTFAFYEVLKIPKSKTLPVQWSIALDFKIKDMAGLFGVSYTSMKYRLSDLGLVTGVPCHSDFTDLF